MTNSCSNRKSPVSTNSKSGFKVDPNQTKRPGAYFYDKKLLLAGETDDLAIRVDALFRGGASQEIHDRGEAVLEDITKDKERVQFTHRVTTLTDHKAESYNIGSGKRPETPNPSHRGTFFGKAVSSNHPRKIDSGDFKLLKRKEFASFKDTCL